MTSAKAWRERLGAWIAPRWGGAEAAARLLAKPVPRNVSWLHTLGSLLLLYLGFQLLTGILLGFYYSPAAETAYQSMQYVQEELYLGRFLHRLHRYGSGFVIVTAFAHMARSYFLAAYKSPRELLWASGVVLFILLTLFAFTGQLLPFDQRGYWATVVGIEIASSAPVGGEAIRNLLTGGYGDIGPTTLSRFYVLHICVLPIILLGLIATHLAILQRTGSAGPVEPGDSGEPKRSFYPRQAVKDLLVSAAGAAALLVVAALVASRETGPADPSSSNFTPRPEWYFLSHYMILKWLPGRWMILGTFVLPNVALAALLLLPFLDRKPDRAPRRRRAMVSIGVAACAAIVVLTGIGVAEEARESAAAEATPSEAAARNPVERGREIFFEPEGCVQCHTIEGRGGTEGPDLSNVGARLRTDYMKRWIRNPSAFKPDTVMPAFEGTEAELDAVVQYLSTLE